MVTRVLFFLFFVFCCALALSFSRGGLSGVRFWGPAGRSPCRPSLRGSQCGALAAAKPSIDLWDCLSDALNGPTAHRTYRSAQKRTALGLLCIESLGSPRATSDQNPEDRQREILG